MANQPRHPMEELLLETARALRDQYGTGPQRDRLTQRITDAFGASEAVRETSAGDETEQLPATPPVSVLDKT